MLILFIQTHRGIGYGGYIVEKEESEVLGNWSDLEKSKSSTLTELEAVNRTLYSL